MKTTEPTTIDRRELSAMLETGRATLVMAMGRWAHDRAHIPGSVYCPTFADSLTALRPDDEIVVYAAGPTCPTALALARQLVRHGFRQVRHFAGGLEEWTAAGLQIEGLAA